LSVWIRFSVGVIQGNGPIRWGEHDDPSVSSWGQYGGAGHE
jgi:hypothetical protein